MLSKTDSREQIRLPNGGMRKHARTMTSGKHGKCLTYGAYGHILDTDRRKEAFP